MTDKIFIPQGETIPLSHIGATIEALAATISARRDAGDESYTYRLLTGNEDGLLKKVMEEAGEVALAAKDIERAANQESLTGNEHARSAAVDHLRYEAADVVYHLLVVLDRYGISTDEFAAELNNRMTDGERPTGGVRLFDEYVKRGK
ncbi:MAG: phosphoribosyl-ATP diphosphatase [Raoultibacter sp.]